MNKISLAAGLVLGSLCFVCAHAGTGLNVERHARQAGDGDGHGVAQRAGTFTTANGAQGGRTQRIARSEDGAVSASSRADASGDNGSAATHKSFTRSADGSTASAERTTSATNQNTGVSYQGSTTWTQGAGLSRSGSCKDSSGKTVACGSQR